MAAPPIAATIMVPAIAIDCHSYIRASVCANTALPCPTSAAGALFVVSTRYIVMAYRVMAYKAMACMVVAFISMAYIVMAYIVMAR